nr:uncharacterized protein LOC123766771 [Procambarus clarkii]
MAINNVAVPWSLLLVLLLVLELCVLVTPKEEVPDTPPAVPKEALNAMVMRHLKQFHQVGEDQDVMWKKELWPPTPNEDYENLLSDGEDTFNPMVLALRHLAGHNMESLVAGTVWDTHSDGDDGADDGDDTNSRSSRAPSSIFHPSALLNPMHRDQEE